MWQRNVSPITAKGRVSQLNKGMGNNFHIGDITRSYDISFASASRLSHLRTRNHGFSPDPNDSNLSVHSSGCAKFVFGLRVVGTNVRLVDDDDDIDESAIPGFSHPTMRPSTPPLNKGKSRAPEQLALPTSSAPPNQLSGNIGTPAGGATRGARQNFGGVQVESR